MHFSINDLSEKREIEGTRCSTFQVSTQCNGIPNRHQRPSLTINGILNEDDPPSLLHLSSNITMTTMTRNVDKNQCAPGIFNLLCDVSSRQLSRHVVGVMFMKTHH